MWTHLPKQPRSNHPLLLKPLKSQSPLGPVGGPLPKGQTWAEHQEPRRGLSADGTGNPRPQTPAQGQRSRGGVKGSHYSFLKDASPSEKGHGWKGAMQGPYKHKLRIAPQILVTLQVCAPKWQYKQNWVHLPPHTVTNSKLLRLSVQRNPNFLAQNSHPQWPPDGSCPALSNSFKPPQPASSNPLKPLPPTWPSSSVSLRVAQNI